MEQSQQFFYEDQACFFNVQPYEVELHEKDLPLFKSIGAIICFDEGLTYKGTAFLIGPTMVLTAAHNIFAQSKKQNGLRKNIMFYPKAFGKLETGIKITKVQVSEEYKAGKKQIAYDFAFCLLESEVDEDLSIEIGYNFEAGALKSSKTSKIHIYGYPGQNWEKLNPDISKYEYKVSLRGLHVPHEYFSEHIKPIDLHKGQIRHLISTKEGQSGSPIIAEINGDFIAIGLVKGAKYKTIQGKKEPDFNGGVLFNMVFIQRLKQFISKNIVRHIRISNIELLSLNGEFWDIDSMERICSFEVKDGLVTRSQSWSQMWLGIRSVNLTKLFFYSSVLKLRLINFHDEANDPKIQFGVVIKSNNKQDLIGYITYKKYQQGRISKKGKVLFKECEEDLFISSNQFVDLTVDLGKGEVSFAKGYHNKKNSQGRKYSIPLEKSSSQKVEVFFYTKMLCEGSSFEVVPEMMEQL